MTTLGLQCVFPFKYDGVTYEDCAYRSSNPQYKWCATTVDSSGVLKGTHRGTCKQITSKYSQISVYLCYIYYLVLANFIPEFLSSHISFILSLHKTWESTMY